jgi:hypothetical protein
MGEKAGKGNNCDSCAEKECKRIVAGRAKLRAARLNIVVTAPLFSQLYPANATCLKQAVLSTLVGDLILLDTEAHHRSQRLMKWLLLLRIVQVILLNTFLILCKISGLYHVYYSSDKMQEQKDRIYWKEWGCMALDGCTEWQILIINHFSLKLWGLHSCCLVTNKVTIHSFFPF